MRELSDSELERLDDVHNTIHQMLCCLAGTEIPWDISVIGEISNIAEQHICGALGIMTPAEFTPFVESTPNDQAHFSEVCDSERRNKVKRIVRHSTCKHCGQPIRLHGGVWVHDDPDEDSTAEDYGWVKCLPNEDGSFEYAEPNDQAQLQA